MERASRLIILFPCFRGEMVVAAVRARAYGYLCNRLSSPELINAIRAVHAGETVLNSTVISLLVRTISEQERVKLTRRERDVLQLVADGLRNKEIARHLRISEATAKLHVAHIFERMGVNGRVEALTKGLQLSIISAP